MTRFIHDLFAKDYLEELLSPYGQVKPDQKVISEKREIDVLFIPNTTSEIITQNLGLLGILAQNDAIFEPFRNPVTINEICSCLLKALEVRESIQRQIKRKNTLPETLNFPYLWILTPTASTSILESFRAILDENQQSGIYFLPDALKTAIVVIHQLAKTPDTLWLRILGRGNVQKQAIDELESLPSNNQQRVRILELFYQLQENLKINQSLEEDDRELIMRLKPLYQEKLADVEQKAIERGLKTGLQQGLQQGERLVVENMLKVRFGELDAELSGVIEAILALPPEEFTPLLMNLSRDELITRFKGA